MPDTSTSAIPALSDAAIEQRVGRQSFERGRRYFRDGMIFEARQSGATLKARCHGSSGGPYRLWVTFDGGHIAAANCSCPVGGGGYCKHIAALLLTWRDRSEAFTPAVEVDHALEQRSKEELIALVKQMLRQQPELESLLEVPLPVAGKQQVAADPSVYRRQAAAAFAGAADSWEWGAAAAVAGQLQATVAIGADFARQENYPAAAAVYRAVIEETLQHYEMFRDDEGDLGAVVSECAEGLGSCLSAISDSTTRESIFRTLLDITETDMDIGGIGLDDTSIGFLLEDTTPQERHMIAGWVREEMPADGGTHGNWARNAYGGMLLALEADTLDDETFLRICRETGRTENLVDRLLALGRIDEAVEAVSQLSDYQLLTLARVFDTHGQRELAERLMAERVPTTKDTRIHEWLRERYRASGNYPAAQRLADQLFRTRPDLHGYQKLRELAQRTDTWETVRRETLDFLRKGGWKDLLVAIALDEGEVDEALDALRNLGSAIAGYGYGLYGRDSLALQVARAAADSRPHEALAIFREQVERLIGWKNRTNYAEAARLLLEMQEIYLTAGDEEAWLDYLEDLRSRYKSLRALKDEMEKAGL